VARSALQQVGAVIAEYAVLAGTAVDPVIAGPAIQLLGQFERRIVLFADRVGVKSVATVDTADKGIVPIVAENTIEAGDPVDEVTSLAAAQYIIVAETHDEFSGIRADDLIRCRRSYEYTQR